MTYSRLRIVHVEAGRHLYGGALQVRYLVGGLADRGIENILVCPPGADVAEALPDRSAHRRPLTMRGDADLGFAWRLARVLRRERPHLVHVHSRRGADILGGLAARMAGIPAVLSRRVDNRDPLLRAKCGPYGRVVAISRDIRRVLLDAGVPPDRIRCVHSAVDTQAFRPGGDRAWLRREFRLPEQGPVLGMVAQLIRRKGHRYLLSALPVLLRRYPDLVVLLLGRGPEETVLRRLATALGVDRAVRFAGYRTDMPRILPALDLVVHPVTSEGLGVSLLQASACGVPVVASRVGGIPEIVHTGETGLLVPSGNVDALARATMLVLADARLRVRMGQAGRELVRRAHTIDSMTEANLRVYDGLLDVR